MTDKAPTTSPAQAGEATPSAPGTERTLILRIGVQHAHSPGSLTDRMAQATAALLANILAQSVPQIAAQCLRDCCTTHRPPALPGEVAGQAMIAFSIEHEVRALSAEEAGAVEVDISTAFAAAGQPRRLQ